MSPLRDSLAEYLTVRRALGYRLERAEKLLHQFLDHLDATGADQITVERALEWATLPAGAGAWHSLRLQAVRGFARYLHEVDPGVEVPAAELLPDRPHRATPYLYTDQEILALIKAASTLGTPHRTATFRTLFGVLAVTGMRIGEAIALDRSDFDADHGVLVPSLPMSCETLMATELMSPGGENGARDVGVGAGWGRWPRSAASRRRAERSGRRARHGGGGRGPGAGRGCAAAAVLG